MKSSYFSYIATGAFYSLENVYAVARNVLLFAVACINI